MPAFLDNISPFYGTGEKNESGQDLENFLHEYNAQKYENPSITVDTLVFCINREINPDNFKCKLLMVKRKNHPCIGLWALPGGFVNLREDLKAAAKRELEEETGLSDIPVEYLYTWGEAERDPRARIVTASYLSIVEEEHIVEGRDDAADALWMNLEFFALSVEDSDNRIHKVYHLVLSCKEKGININAEVEVSQNKHGLLKEKEYKVLQSSGIAFDHSRIITQAVLYLKQLLEEQDSR